MDFKSSLLIQCILCISTYEIASISLLFKYLVTKQQPREHGKILYRLLLLVNEFAPTSIQPPPPPSPLHARPSSFTPANLRAKLRGAYSCREKAAVPFAGGRCFFKNSRANSSRARVSLASFLRPVLNFLPLPEEAPKDAAF